jgi:hypothetical protein
LTLFKTSNFESFYFRNQRTSNPILVFWKFSKTYNLGSSSLICLGFFLIFSSRFVKNFKELAVLVKELVD